MEGGRSTQFHDIMLVYSKRGGTETFYDPVSVDSRLDASFSEEFLRIFSKSKPFHFLEF